MEFAHYIILLPKLTQNQHLQKFKRKADNIEQGIFKDGREQEVIGEY